MYAYLWTLKYYLVCSLAVLFLRQSFYQLGRDATDDRFRFNILCDHRSCCHCSPLSNTNPRQNSSTSSDPAIRLDNNGQGEGAPDLLTSPPVDLMCASAYTYIWTNEDVVTNDNRRIVVNGDTITIKDDQYMGLVHII